MDSQTSNGEGSANDVQASPSAVDLLVVQLESLTTNDTAVVNVQDYLTKFPLEISYKIASDPGLTSRDLAALAATSRQHYSVANPVLYKKHVQEEYGVAVLWAVWNERIGTLKKLVDNGVDINSDEASEWVARRVRLYPWVKELLLSDPIKDINAPSDIDLWLQRSLLHVASGVHQWHFTPLALAASKGSAAAVTWLLDHGAHVDCLSEGLCKCKNKLYKTPKMWRLRQWAPGTPVVIPQARWAPLHLAIHYGHDEVVKLLLARGANPAQVCRPVDGPCTALHSAAVHRRRSVVDYLLVAGLVAVDARGHGGMTLLHLAYCLREMKLVDVALIHGAYINLGFDVDGNEWTPFAMACVENDMDFALRALKMGANPDFGLTTEAGDVCTPLIVINGIRQAEEVYRLGWRVSKEGNERKLKAVEDEIRRCKQDYELALRDHEV